MFKEQQPPTNPNEQFSQLMNLLADRPDLKQKMVPDILLIQELAPELERKVLQIASGFYGKINCNGTSVYLIGLTEKPMRVSPIKEMIEYLKSMTRNKELLPGSLVCYTAHPGLGEVYVPHSGILFLSKSGEQLVLHKPSYEDPLKIEPIEKAFDLKNVRGAGELESYSLK
ncbi:hypothetical protein A3A95_01965 [Candidatus Nomurabacteria bacterium RIFCSPLOWO2_01_FULL_39_18]|uniref:Uncharacterized protein n=1 Tax=Candidatus Nomurabacteria bacterium RIFCSPHIGHO2_01_FULL_40_24b TaxID=1801739 RepID=A0A1F6V9G4_9BACT|nr:MAG: hypothetical protein A2647_00750 [Candidatus Nomurabacteria bacterium RIFCSPHIGHO2_01_FULL_40_24b]OGI90630.1 MAG: hypothetical protein A3A95_01965 [Candidatus Nomurabacteria bacterium RIFCSPLOWO2_01_FULL_39_18]